MSEESEWGIKLRPRELATLQKTATQTIEVVVESVSSSPTSGVIYYVRELVSREGYPASQHSLKSLHPKKGRA